MLILSKVSAKPPLQFIDRWLRRDREEILESGDFSLEQRYSIVDQLGIIMRRTGYNQAYLALLEQILMPSLPWKAGRPLSICEFGPGSGAMLRSIHIWARKLSLPIELHGIEIDSDFALLTQQKLRDEGINAVIHTGNATNLAGVADNSFDAVISSNMAHHIRSHEEIGRMFREAERVSRLGWLMVDLERRLRGLPFMLLGPLLGGSRILAVDGVRSVRRAYYRNEIQEIADQNTREFGTPAVQVTVCHLFPYWWISRRKA